MRVGGYQLGMANYQARVSLIIAYLIMGFGCCANRRMGPPQNTSEIRGLGCKIFFDHLNLNYK